MEFPCCRTFPRRPHESQAPGYRAALGGDSLHRVWERGMRSHLSEKERIVEMFYNLSQEKRLEVLASQVAGKIANAPGAPEYKSPMSRAALIAPPWAPTITATVLQPLVSPHNG